ncbi:MAG: hypothetical protein ACXU8U_06245 [Asticcacaulis sp.]
MKDKRWMLYLAIFGAAVAGGLLGGFNYHWSHLPKFPIYGYAADLIVFPLLVGLILYARRLKLTSVDEFSVVKKRIAAATGMAFGMIAFVALNAVPILLPQPYHAFLASLDGTEDAYLMGRVVGMAPFAIGLFIGQIVTWARYR